MCLPPTQAFLYMKHRRFMSHVPLIQVNAEKVKSGPDGLFVINALSCQ